MVVERRSGHISHLLFRDLPDILQPGDLLVLNETRVLPARLHARRQATGGLIEILLMGENPDNRRWQALLRPVRKVKPGDRLVLSGEEGWLEVCEKGEYGLCLLQPCFAKKMEALMAEHGETPLPPYIKRGKPAWEEEDRERYQTIYARVPGSIAAPTAGFHFTPEVLDRLAQRQIETSFLTLHVGPATFQPVRVENIEHHLLPAEKVHISRETAQQIQKARNDKRRVIAVGTTSARALESSAAGHAGIVKAGEAWADLYIHPPYSFQVIGGLITNFHLPRSSLLILVASFAGRELILDCYKRAIGEKYRFYSYGDGMVIL